MKEYWVNIDNLRGYQASNLGRIKSLVRWNNKVEKILKTRVCRNGYETVKIRKKDYKVHRLIALCFIKNSENKKTVNHINGIKTDNRRDNLEWATQKENVNHAVKNKMFPCKKGENNGMAKLDNNDVVFIREIIKTKFLKQYQVAEMFNVNKETIGNIKRLVTWRHI